MTLYVGLLHQIDY